MALALRAATDGAAARLTPVINQHKTTAEGLLDREQIARLTRALADDLELYGVALGEWRLQVEAAEAALGHRFWCARDEHDGSRRYDPNGTQAYAHIQPCTKCKQAVLPSGGTTLYEFVKHR